MNLYQKLIEVRKSLPYFQKGEKSYGYNYVKGSNILVSLQNQMNGLGVLLFPEINNHEIKQFTDNKGKEQFIFNSQNSYMVFVNAEKPEEVLKVSFQFIGKQDDPSKAYGSALTYSERYFLMKFFNIPTDEDDPDKWEAKHQSKEEKTLKAFSEAVSLFDNLVMKGLIPEAEKDILMDMVEKAKNDEGKLVAVIKQLKSRDVDLTSIKNSIKKGLGSLEYEEKHTANSIKKHLGVSNIDECNNVQKLKAYQEHLRSEYKNKIEKEKDRF